MELQQHDDSIELWVYEAETNTPIGIIDAFTDLRIVWCYDEPSTLEVNVPVTLNLHVEPEMVIWPSGGREAFFVETTVLEEQEDGDMMTVTALSCSAMLKWRGLEQAVFYEGTGGAIIKKMLDSVFSDSRRTIPMLAYDIDVSLGAEITYETEPMELLEAIENVCKASGLGFRTKFDNVTHQLLLTIYEGIDRTATENNEMPVIFDAELENITRATYTNSIQELANVAYVMGEKDSKTDARKRVEYDPDALTGYARREVVLESGKSSTTDEKDSSGNNKKLTEAQYLQLLRDYGKEKLAWMNRTNTAEAELVTDSKLMQLGREYDLGDIVLVRNNRWGIKMQSRLKELEETFDKGIRVVRPTVGSRLPTILEKMTRL